MNCATSLGLRAAVHRTRRELTRPLGEERTHDAWWQASHVRAILGAEGRRRWRIVYRRFSAVTWSTAVRTNMLLEFFQRTPRPTAQELDVLHLANLGLVVLRRREVDRPRWMAEVRPSSSSRRQRQKQRRRAPRAARGPHRRPRGTWRPRGPGARRDGGACGGPAPVELGWREACFSNGSMNSDC